MTGRRAGSAAGVAVAVVASSAAGWLLGRRECLALRERAERDQLTGLLNRAGLRATAGAAFRASVDGRMGGLLLDLDGFKPVNDTYGHAAGDQVLVAAARRIAGAVGGWHGVAARLGGDEFAVLLPGLPGGEAAAAEAVIAVGRDLAAVLGEPYEVGGRVLRVGVSIGAATAGPPFVLNGLLSAADVAMYAAKRSGGGVVATPSVGLQAELVAAVVPQQRQPAQRLRDAAHGRSPVGAVRVAGAGR